MPYRKLPIVVVLAAVLVTGTASGTLADDGARRRTMFQLLNRVRMNHGLPTFRINLELSHKAWIHSGRMADRNRLFHSADLYDKVRAYRPSTWGENVGYAATLRRLRSLWMNSAGHRANILNPRFRRIGIGVVQARGVMWVTSIFYGG
jgi:uncharacterized protein YkwD